MKQRCRYNNKEGIWEPNIIRVIVHYDDERLAWASVREIATDLFKEAGYIVGGELPVVTCNGVDFGVTSSLYEIIPN